MYMLAVQPCYEAVYSRLMLISRAGRAATLASNSSKNKEKKLLNQYTVCMMFVSSFVFATAFWVEYVIDEYIQRGVCHKRPLLWMFMRGFEWWPVHFQILLSYTLFSALRDTLFTCKPLNRTEWLRFEAALLHPAWAHVSPAVCCWSRLAQKHECWAPYRGRRV